MSSKTDKALGKKRKQTIGKHTNDIINKIGKHLSCHAVPIF
jgi:hypothetical protein